jgi:hypothetical protein
MIRTWILRGGLGLAALAATACGQSARTSTQSMVSTEQVERMKTAVAPMVDRSQATVELTQSKQGLSARVLSGNRDVLVTRRNDDGSLTTGCVDSVKGVETTLTSAAPSHAEAR